MQRTGTGAGGGYQLVYLVVDWWSLGVHPIPNLCPTQIALGDVFKTNSSNDIENQVTRLKSG